MAEYRLTPAAERDLEAIWNHTLRQWGAEQANRYTDILAAAFAELAQSLRQPRHVIKFGQTIVVEVAQSRFARQSR